MADNTLQAQKHPKKVNFSEQNTRPYFSANKNKRGHYRGHSDEGAYTGQSSEGDSYEGHSKGGPYKGQSQGNPYKDQTLEVGLYKGQSEEDPYRSQTQRHSERGSYKNQSERGSYKGQSSKSSYYSQPPKEQYFNKNRNQSSGPYNKTNIEASFEAEGPYNKSSNGQSFDAGSPYNKNRGSSRETQYFKSSSDFYHPSNRNQGYFEFEGKNKGYLDSEGPYHGRNRGDHRVDHTQGDRKAYNQSRDYESINKNRGGHNVSHLQRSRSFGQSGVGKAMENFGVRDLRELLDRKQQNKDDNVDKHIVEPKKKIPPSEPGYSFLKDPLRENPQNEENGAKNTENQNDNEPRNKNRPNQDIYQPNRNRKVENLPKITIKNNQPTKNDDSRSEKPVKYNKPRHNLTAIETMKDLPNIKIQLTVDNNSRTAELDESLKIVELKHFPDDDVKNRGNFRGRGRGRPRGGFRSRGMGRGNRYTKDKTVEGESVDNGSFDNPIVKNDGEDENFGSGYAEDFQNELTKDESIHAQKQEEMVSELKTGKDSVITNPMNAEIENDGVEETTFKLKDLNVNKNENNVNVLKQISVNSTDSYDELNKVDKNRVEYTTSNLEDLDVDDSKNKDQVSETSLNTEIESNNLHQIDEK